jgi:hypothetical protein
MSYGLRLWNASGVLTLDVTDRLMREIGQVTGGLSPGQSATFQKPASENPVYFMAVWANPAYPNNWNMANWRVTDGPTSLTITCSTYSEAYVYLIVFYII